MYSPIQYTILDMILYVSVINKYTQYTQTHSFIHPDDSHARKHVRQYSFQASLEQAAEELDSVVMEQLLEQVPQALLGFVQQFWIYFKRIHVNGKLHYDIIIVAVCVYYIYIYIYVRMYVVHFKIGLHS